MLQHVASSQVVTCGRKNVTLDLNHIGMLTIAGAITLVTSETTADAPNWNHDLGSPESFQAEGKRELSLFRSVCNE